MSLHHATLKTLVKNYGSLHLEGKSEDEVKAAIAGDPKNLDEDQVDEVYQAIVAQPSDNNPGKENENPNPVGKKTAKAIVAQPFREKGNYDKLYKVGEDVSHFDEKRLARLKEKGLIK